MVVARSCARIRIEYFSWFFDGIKYIHSNAENGLPVVSVEASKYVDDHDSNDEK